MQLYDRIKAMRGKLADDGSKELADSYIELIQNEAAARELMNNDAFRAMLDLMEGELRVRIGQMVEEDPELRAIKNVFIRTVGLQGAEKHIENAIKDFIKENPEIPQ